MLPELLLPEGQAVWSYRDPAVRAFRRKLWIQVLRSNLLADHGRGVPPCRRLAVRRQSQLQGDSVCRHLHLRRVNIVETVEGNVSAQEAVVRDPALSLPLCLNCVVARNGRCATDYEFSTPSQALGSGGCRGARALKFACPFFHSHLLFLC